MSAIHAIIAAITTRCDDDHGSIQAVYYYGTDCKDPWHLISGGTQFPGSRAATVAIFRTAVSNSQEPVVDSEQK